MDIDRNANWHGTRNEKEEKFKPETMNVNSMQEL